jgi:hypothetical protein
MDEATARSLYHGKDRLNCGQAVLKAFQTTTGMSDAEIAVFHSAGAGGAEDGVCGALYAARHLQKDKTALRSLDQAFVTEAGSIHCKEIRKIKKLPCVECVALAARLLMKSAAGTPETRSSEKREL